MTANAPATAATVAPDVEANARGIPRAPFIDDVTAHVGGSDVDGGPALDALQEMLRKYRFMESNTLQRRQGFEGKIPELEQTLQTLRLLRKAKAAETSLTTTFELSETVYADAVVEPVEDVCLWLGANVMLSYPVEEAEALIDSKLKDANNSLVNANEDLDWLRDQITTTEVNVARVYNWDVKRRRDAKTAVEV